MAAPRHFECNEGPDEFGVSSVAFPDELALADVRRDVTLVARLD